ncbi:ACT domain-containing protein [Butyrivibrio sp. VCD2006]|uniref:ACT domain-containing protein n=1 Tax=Butyrivibrio sp. VCD2006 TaxID=1280664 RepID=UPI0004288500|nr:ACT domain-containing protein [Butyrivibrio sp. VCD2006]
MELKRLENNFTVCKVEDFSGVDMNREFVFVGKTDEEISLVCDTEIVPDNTTERSDGWKAFRIEGKLDFTLIGILSKISTALAKNNIGIFAVSTYNTDYILVKAEDFEKAMAVLDEKGYRITG